MQVEALRYFVELAHVGSFYRASKNVFISQQGLNKAISALETELGVKLIERGNRGVRLTSAGEVFLEHAQTLLANYHNMLSDLYATQLTASSDDRRLVVHVTYYPAQIAGPFIERMDIIDSVSVVEEPFQRIVEGALETEGDELFLCDLFDGEAMRDAYPDLLFEPMVSSWAGVVWHEGSPLQGHAAIHRDQLADQPLSVDSNREMLRLLEHVMQDYPLNNIRFGIANPRARIEYAVSSDQVSLLFDSFGFMLAQANPTMKTDGLHFTPFSTPRAGMQIGFLYNRRAKPNVRARHAIEVLRAHLRDQYAGYFAQYPLF